MYIYPSFLTLNSLIIHQGAGWHQEQVPRFQPILEPHRMEVNAPLKLVWKLVAALPEECRAVLAAVDATHLTSAGTYTPVTVLLTPQVSGVAKWGK